MVFELKQKFGSELTIVSSGCKDGADKYARKYASLMKVVSRMFSSIVPSSVLLENPKSFQSRK